MKNFEQKKYRLISFDLETTGLDTKKDEIIQIWIVEFWLDWKTISSYESYIKTEKNISDMVNYITWLDEKILQNAPDFDQIRENVLSYFQKNCILIWHNINFDISILKRYIDFECDYIDTYKLSKSLIPFCPSYWLESITNYLKLEKLKFHDALSDSILAKNLFLNLYEKTIFLAKKFPTLAHVIQNSQTTIKYLINIEWENTGLTNLEKKEKKSSTNVQQNEVFEYWEKILVSWKINDIIDFLPKNNVIFALSSLQKCNIIKNILEQKLLPYESIYQNWVLNNEKVEKFLAQKNFDKDEVYFLIKYFFSLENWLTYLDINSPNEYKIFDFLSENYNTQFDWISITTHQNLYKQNLEWKNIVFFDESWWFSTFAKYQNSSLDLSSILNQLELLKYNSKFYDKKIEEIFQVLIDKFSIFIWIYHLEAMSKFRWTSSNHFDANPFLSDIDFWQSQKTLQNILDFIKFNDFWEYSSQVDKIFSNLSSYVDDVYQIEKKMIGENINFLLKKSYPVSYIDFLKIFEKSNTIFLTTNPYKSTKSFWEKWENILINIQKSTQSIINNLDFWKTNFVISLLMKNTKDIFNSLIKSKKNIFAENITGWIWKNVSSIKNSTWSKTIIWSQEMLLALINQWVKIDEIYLLTTGWALEKNILDDMKIYL